MSPCRTWKSHLLATLARRVPAGSRSPRAVWSPRQERGRLSARLPVAALRPARPRSCVTSSVVRASVRAPWRTSAPIAPGGKEPVDTFIRDLAAKAEVAGFDETGVRATGSPHWLHTVSTRWPTWYFAHKRRLAPSRERRQHPARLPGPRRPRLLLTPPSSTTATTLS